MDASERLAEVTTYVETLGGQVGTIFVGKPSDLYGGALSAAVPSSLLPSLAVTPGIAYVQLRIPPREAQASSPPSPAFPNGPDDSSPFTAVFDGDGQTISNLFINRPTAYVGLF